MAYDVLFICSGLPNCGPALNRFSVAKPHFITKFKTSLNVQMQELAKLRKLTRKLTKLRIIRYKWKSFRCPNFHLRGKLQPKLQKLNLKRSTQITSFLDLCRNWKFELVLKHSVGAWYRARSSLFAPRISRFVRPFVGDFPFWVVPDGWLEVFMNSNRL